MFIPFPRPRPLARTVYSYSLILEMPDSCSPLLRDWPTLCRCQGPQMSAGNYRSCWRSRGAFSPLGKRSGRPPGGWQKQGAHPFQTLDSSRCQPPWLPASYSAHPTSGPSSFDSSVMPISPSPSSYPSGASFFSPVSLCLSCNLPCHWAG